MIVRDEYDIVRVVSNLKDRFADESFRPLEVLIELYDETNTKAQKRLYWKWIDLMIKTTGNFKYEQDELLRKIILSPITHTNSKGKEKEYYKHVSELGKKEMAEYMTQVSIMSAQHGINLPHPEDLQRNE